MIERSENAASRWTGLWDAVGTTVTKGERIRKRALPAMLGAAARKIGMAYGRGEYLCAMPRNPRGDPWLQRRPERSGRA